MQYWIWADITKHRDLYIKAKGNCRFNHIIGLSRNNKTGRENLLFDYQQIIKEASEKYRHLYILKATGREI